MFQHRERGLIQLYRLATALLLTVFFWGYYLLLQHGIEGIELVGAEVYLRYFVVILLSFQLSFLGSQVEDILSVSKGWVASHRFIAPHMLFATAVTCVYLVLTRDAGISRFFLFTFLPLAYLGLVAFNRWAALDVLASFVQNGEQSLLLIGQAAEVQNVASLLGKARLFGLRPAGILTESPERDLPTDLPCLGKPEDLEAVLDRQPIGNILILGSPRDRRMLAAWLRLAESHGCRVSLVNDLDVFLQRPLSYFRCDDVDLIELREEPLQNSLNRAAKRLMDIGISLPLVVFVLPPLTLLVWLLQRWQAPGPVLFRQVRSGLDNRPFTILKFRTMFEEFGDSQDQAGPGDPRVFPAGRWLRRFSLDEFPQFYNVLRGQMSLAGPRPHMTQHDRVFARALGTYRLRGFVKPGITGLAQIRGLRGAMLTPEEVGRRVESDIEYIENWSLALDLEVLWRTIVVVLRPPPGAV